MASMGWEKTGKRWSGLPPFYVPDVMRVFHIHSACLEQGGGNRSLAQDTSLRTPPVPCSPGYCVADNGCNRSASITAPMGGEIHVFYDYVTADGRLEGGKGKMNDAGTSVPLIASWPGLSPAGKVLDDLIDFSYFFPTLCEAARCQLPKDRIIDGRTFFPQVVGHKSMPREWVFCHYWKNGRTREGVQEFARDTRWKLYDDSKLYDIKNDLLEDSPLGETEEVTTVRKRLQAALVAARIGP